MLTRCQSLLLAGSHNNLEGEGKRKQLPAISYSVVSKTLARYTSDSANSMKKGMALSSKETFPVLVLRSRVFYFFDLGTPAKKARVLSR